jgi:hypothetical protein
VSWPSARRNIAVLALAGAILLPARADAGPAAPVTEHAPSHWSCSEYADYLRWIDGVAAPGDLQDVALHAGFVFVAAGTAGIHVFDPATRPPTLVTTLDTPGVSRAIAVSGQLAYVADEVGLQIVDLSSPTSPALLGALPTAGSAVEVEVDGAHAYIAVAFQGLVIADVSSAAAPELVGAVSLPDARAVAVQSSMAYVAVGSAGLQIVDAADPADPQLRGALPAPSASRDVAIRGNTCYLGALSDGLMVVDVTDPDLPVLTRTIRTAPVGGFEVAGDLAYVGQSMFGMRVLDLVAGSQAGFVELGLGFGRVERGIAVSGGLAYVANRERLEVVDVRHPVNPPRTSSIRLKEDSREIATVGDVAYVATFHGLEIVDLSDPWHPEAVGSLALPGDATGVDVQAGLAYVAATPALYVIDVLDPAAPAVVGVLGNLGTALDVVVSGDYAYVAGGSAGLSVVDVSDLSTPSQVAGEPSTGWRIDHEGSHVFLFSNPGQLAHIIDVSNPLAPFAVAHVDGPTGGSSDGGDGVVSGDLLYLTRGHDVEIWDVGDAASPNFLGSVSGPVRGGAGIAVRHGRAYLGGSFVTGLQVFDVADPAAPSFEGAAGPLASSSDVALLDDRVVTAGLYGLSVFALDCNASPSPLAGRTVPSVAATAPGATTRMTVQPNPFRDKTAISWTMDRSELVSVAVYDVAGRLVRTIADGIHPAGPHSVTWDGLDDRRRGAAGGVYFVRLETGDLSRTRRMVLVR